MKCYSADGENYNYTDMSDLFDSNDELEVGSVIHIADAVHPSCRELFSIDYVLESIQENAYDFAGEYAEDYPNTTREQDKELEDMIVGWMKKYAQPTFYKVVNSVEYILIEEDLT